MTIVRLILILSVIVVVLAFLFLLFLFSVVTRIPCLTDFNLGN